ncbi:MAG: hypothetical protein HDT33_01420 [Clostridiales bacterium]|nr:hypothetical protein [Clostridiales bacterium]
MLAGCAPAAETPAPDPIPTASAAVPTPAPAPTPEPTPTPEPMDFYEFLDGVNAAREAMYTGEEPIDLSAYTPDFHEQNHTFTEAEMKVLTTAHAPEENLTREDLIADAETFFTLLQTTYGAYYYFGGDDTFLPLLDEVKKDLAAAEDPTVDTLEEILFQHLSPVLVDGHFVLGRYPMRSTHFRSMYYVPDLYLDSIDGVENLDYIKPTIGPDGRICWWYAALSRDGSDLPDALDGNQLSWQIASWFPSNPSARIFSTSEWNGIPILTSRSMSTSDDYGHEVQVRVDALEELASCGGDYKDSPLLIFDVRNNGGGNDPYIRNWFQDWTGEDNQDRRTSAYRFSQLSCRLLNYPVEQMGTYHTYSQAGGWVERSGPVFVLQDKGVASSGESAVALFRTAADTLLVGGPTGGLYLTPGNRTFYLPNTGLSCYFGIGLGLCETGENIDCVGFLPDLWVEPQQALALVKKLIEYYGLAEAG